MVIMIDTKKGINNDDKITKNLFSNDMVIAHQNIGNARSNTRLNILKQFDKIYSYDDNQSNLSVYFNLGKKKEVSNG